MRYVLRALQFLSYMDIVELPYICAALIARLKSASVFIYPFLYQSESRGLAHPRPHCLA